MKKRLILLVALAGLQHSAPAAPIPVSGTMTYTQNFDSLGTASPVWANDATIPGWYVQMAEGLGTPGPANATDGNGTVLIGLLNCGTTGAADRALGSKCTSGASGTSSSNANISFAVSFHNTGVTPVKLSSLDYTGENWRTGSTANVSEHYTLFYQISAAPVTNIHSGGNTAIAQPGPGFTAMDAAANWTSPPNASPAIAIDGNAAANRTAISFAPANIEVGPGKYLTIKWTDPNESDTDGYQAIDDVSVQFTEVSGLVDPVVSNLTRDTKGTDDPTDDTFGFTVKVTGSGSVSAGWTTPDANPPAGNPSAASYGTAVVWTGFPVSGPKTVTITDAVTASLNAAFTVNPPNIIGTNDLGTPGAGIITDGSLIAGWVLDETARTATQNSQTTQDDHVITSNVIALSGTGFAAFTCDLDAISGTTSGFELPDFFSLDLIIDGGAPVSVLGAADVNGDGKLSGAAAGAGTELQDTSVTNMTKSFSFFYLIPDTAGSVQIRITGNSNSANETYLVKNLKLSPPPPTLFAGLASPIATINNKGTADPADDDFSPHVNVEGANLSGSTGWHSDETPVRTGLYAAANPVTFGPYFAAGGAKTVTLADDLNPAITSAALTFTPPVPTLTVSAPANIQRHENGPGPDDDTVSFQLTITGAKGGPGWSATGATPASGAFSAAPVTFTFPIPATGTTTTVTVTDVSYPAATQTVTVTFPGRYTIGQVNLGGGLVNLSSDITTSPAPEWVNDPVARTLTMNAGIATDSIVTSETIDLSAVGEVQFSADFHLAEISDGSNLESTDRFKAELIIDGIANNLVSAWDKGDGAIATTGTGENGPANGYINGYSGTAGIDVLTGIDYTALGAGPEYNANKDRDEFNLLGEDFLAHMDNHFPLSFTIPASANSVQLKIYGTGIAGSETATVSSVLFTAGTTAGGDSDGDGVSDTNEEIMGTDPHNAADVLRLTQNPAAPLQMGFPSKTGRFYRVYVSDDTDGQEDKHLLKWKDAGLTTIAGDGTAKQFSVTVLPTEKRRFYRLHVMLIDGPWPATAP